jgi:hypothetical protein
MTVHAFVDESRRGSQYIVAVAIAEPANLRYLRRDLRLLLLPGQRELHFKAEQDPRRRTLTDAIARLPVELQIYRHSCTRFGEPARQRCLDQITRDLLNRGAHRLVLDSRSQLDTKDEATIRAAVARHPHRTRFVYEHVGSANESMLWIADAAAWCFGAGGHWKKRIDKIITAVVNVHDA